MPENISGMLNAVAEGSHRVWTSRPPTAAGACLIAPSGAFSRLDMPSDECELIVALMSDLASRSIVSFVPELPPRGLQPASAPEVAERTGRIRAVHDTYLSNVPGPIAWVGFSLGAQSLLQIATDVDGVSPPPRSLVLIGCVLERPAYIVCDVRSVVFLYGERDHLVYRTDDGLETEVLSPADYGPRVAAQVVVRNTQQRSVETWADCSHLLVGPQSPSATVIASTLGRRIEELLS